jgi:hypothetical protein
VVLPGLYAVGQCANIPQFGASEFPGGWIKHYWYNCAPVTEPISCSTSNTGAIPRKNSGTQFSVDRRKENISEEIKRMNRLISY